MISHSMLVGLVSTGGFLGARHVLEVLPGGREEERGWLTLDTRGVEMWWMTSGLTPLGLGLLKRASRLRRRPLSPLGKEPLYLHQEKPS